MNHCAQCDLSFAELDANTNTGCGALDCPRKYSLLRCPYCSDRPQKVQILNAAVAYVAFLCAAGHRWSPAYGAKTAEAPGSPS